MKAQLIVAYSDNTWQAKMVEVPEGVVPDKYHRGSVKWNGAVIKWATSNVDLVGDEEEDTKIEYIGMMNANPDAEE